MTLQYTDADGSFYEWDVIINFGNDLINHNVSDSGSRYPHEKISITANQKQGAKRILNLIGCGWVMILEMKGYQVDIIET